MCASVPPGIRPRLWGSWPERKMQLYFNFIFVKPSPTIKSYSKNVAVFLSFSLPLVLFVQCDQIKEWNLTQIICFSPSSPKSKAFQHLIFSILIFIKNINVHMICYKSKHKKTTAGHFSNISRTFLICLNFWASPSWLLGNWGQWLRCCRQCTASNPNALIKLHCFTL